MSIGDRLRSERQRLRLSQTDFAKIGGVGKTTQVLYESGQRVPDANYLAAVAAQGADISFVIVGRRVNSTTSDELDGEILEQILEAIEIWGAQRTTPAPIHLKAELARLFYQQYRKTGEVDDKHMRDHLRLVG